jgi:hypothetical protein
MELIAAGALISLVAIVAAKPLLSRPCTLCKDGWWSSSSGRGTCSWHKGIDD